MPPIGSPLTFTAEIAAKLRKKLLVPSINKIRSGMFYPLVKAYHQQPQLNFVPIPKKRKP
jgi:hypothetical protein